MTDNIQADNSIKNKKDYGKLVKTLQIVAVIFMLAMTAMCVVLIKKYDISVRNIDSIRSMIQGSAAAVAVGIILFSVIKSFTLVFPFAVIFAISGIFFDSIWTALLVNFLATALSLALPYFLGRFTGKGMIDTLSRRFKNIKKLDEFAGANEFAVVACMKASGILANDLSSLIFGAMNISFKNYMIASNLGLLPLNIMYTCLGAYGDLTNPKSYLLLVPIVLFALLSSMAAKKLGARGAAKKASS
ncbi:MAG: VTT domain-containing protein [Clostridiales bacterium]|jgi:uncharacterized membrane protein YdjX (TVP38/TMEM64 family)|nr:VTT domain-containing protein [Clostridiales bacterium]